MARLNGSYFHTADSCSAAANTCASLRSVLGTAEILAVSICVIDLLARIILVVLKKIS